MKIKKYYENKNQMIQQININKLKKKRKKKRYQKVFLKIINISSIHLKRISNKIHPILISIKKK